MREDDAQARAKTVASRWKTVAAHARWAVPLVTRSLAGVLRPRRDHDVPVHLILAIADHYEPRSEARTTPRRSARRPLGRATTRVPSAGSAMPTAGRLGTRSSYPIEMYDARHLEALAVASAAQGFGEVEVHLHHDGDTAETPARTP